MAVGMRVTARCDQAVRAAAELAARRRPATGEDLAAAIGVSLRSLHGILTQLTRAGLLVSQRGAHGGYQLARLAIGITVADVVRALDGPFDDNAQSEAADGPSGILAEVWNALRVSELAVLEAVPWPIWPPATCPTRFGLCCRRLRRPAWGPNPRLLRSMGPLPHARPFRGAGEIPPAEWASVHPAFRGAR
jgi:Rrf2 family protein